MRANIHKEKILILDFGSQYTQLIARKIREKKVYCEIHPFNVGLSFIKRFSPQGIILSGGPASVYEDTAPSISKEIFEMDVPILGICYGMQLIAHLLGGKVVRSGEREYGFAQLMIDKESELFKDFNTTDKYKVWMSHGDRILELPEGFVKIAHSENSPIAAMENKEKKIFGLQFHPEVAHTPSGSKIIKNFLFSICSLSAQWTMKSFVEESIKEIKRRVKDNRVICALSGGVDSSVVALLIHKAIGDNLTAIFVNNGLLRKNEAQTVKEQFKNKFNINLRYVDAEDIFLEKLKGVVDPEEKRKIIGNEFIYLFEKEANKIGDVKFLAQGTLYPDVIESVSFKGPSAVIKSHHNVGGLPERMNLELIEPLRELFKDEVREVAYELGMDEDIIWRQPFPGPGLAIRIIGEVTLERLEVLREADYIVQEEIKKEGLNKKIWQAFAVLLPVKSVGIMGDSRTYQNVVALRMVESRDGMTADWVKLPYDILTRISTRIINEVRGVNRVVYDISSKPPSTIEWE
ncbi:MAG: glutamine-hydrolyzing GMP synthase [Deltaproteobacteria bacterium]|nr:glutamine-hydrolyzing GMP synthase [Deltaproteobacteria bacterium]